MGTRAWLLVTVLCVAGCAGASAPPGGSPPTPAELVGQRLMVRMDGPRPSASLLARVRRGEVGGVILFAPGIRSPSQVQAATDRLQRAARAAGRPPLLIAVDQEGGAVRRIPWAPPVPSAAVLGREGPAAAERIGRETGAALRTLGINVDLAPVADVPTGGSFIGDSGRGWSDDPARAAALVAAFTRGLERAGVIAVPKHFPGLGRADVTTDRAVVTIDAPASALQPALEPFQAAIAAGAPMVMLSNAGYTAWGGVPAGWSPEIIRLLRKDLGFTGVTITDSLDGAAHARGTTPVPLALRSAGAGADILLITGGERTSAGVFTRLLGAARSGRLPEPELVAAYRRVLALKSTLP